MRALLFRAIFGSLFVTTFLTSMVYAQNEDKWTIISQNKIVDLTQVEKIGSTSLRFYLKNVSTKPIVQFRIESPNETITGVDLFASNSKTIAPGELLSVTFDANDFYLKEKRVYRLRVVAVMFSDGTTAGSPKMISQIEDEMLGIALETKRISGILAKSSTENAGNSDYVLKSIGYVEPTSNEDFVRLVKDQSIDTVKHSYVASHINALSDSFRIGVLYAHRASIAEINAAKLSNALNSNEQSTRAMSSGHASKGGADIANIYSKRSSSQALFLSSYLKNGGNNAN